MKLHCAICLMTRTGVAPEAVTIRGGTAVCEDHQSYATDQAVNFALTLELEAKAA